ncbi:MAG: OmpH family outer membrane protein [Muribaculaceae bacterium]|nr:OmpH family outer membrane protein [Muribaculaceae bacterium]MCI5627885.1 OmpH family outer membrane protein [Porphyromonadaceae bacterium]MDD6313952.1 OmpH family outer membrane protein [Porphyromonadaceae bacterium]
MKKIIIALVAVIGFALAGHAQKFAMIDMEYVLRNVPAYEMANTQLSQVSQRWEKEVNELAKEADNLYKTYQSEMVFLSDDQKKAREAEIVKKEDEVSQLRNKYFGPEGELYKKRQSLMKPIQEDVYNAVKAVAEEKGYQAIFDRASSQSIVFASPRIDISNDVLAKLGYAK